MKDVEAVGTDDGQQPAGAARREVAVFDFDGTLTRHDSFLPFVLFLVPAPRLLAGFGVAAPSLLGYAVRVVPNWRAKEALLRGTVRGMVESDLLAAGARFAAARLPRLLRQGALAAVDSHRRRGRRLVLVSASLEAYLRPWGAAVGFDDVLATRLETEEGRLTGRLLGRNCYGEEKVARLQDLLGDISGHVIHAYGDSRGDRELLEIATYPHYRELNHS